MTVKAMTGGTVRGEEERSLRLRIVPQKVQRSSGRNTVAGCQFQRTGAEALGTLALLPELFGAKRVLIGIGKRLPLHLLRADGLNGAYGRRAIVPQRSARKAKNDQQRQTTESPQPPIARGARQNAYG